MRPNPAAVLSLLLLAAAGCETWQPAATPPRAQPAWADGRFTGEERRVLEEFLRSESGSAPGAHQKRLPPGLQKKVARGGTLPPGWQRKVAHGEVMSDDVYGAPESLPAAILSRLPSPPPGTVLRSVGGKVVRMMEATRKILDVLDLGE